MASNTIVGPPASGVEPKRADVYGWDWSATTHEAYDGVVDDLLEALDAKLVLPGRGLQGWSQSAAAYNLDGYKVGTVYFGGGRDDVHVLATSAVAEAARRAVVAADKRGNPRTSRVDTCVDTTARYEDLERLLLEVAGQDVRTTVVRMETLQGQRPGRTLYVGAPSSAVRVRLYEKHLESPGQYEDPVNRVEVQLRPPSRAKERVSTWEPADTFCATKLTRRLADALGTDVTKPGTLQKHRDTPDLERTIEAMGEQYGKAFGKWMTLSGGDLGAVLDHLQRERPRPVVGPVTDDLRFPG